jgi:neural Wiskott-Aldrich syndrome protein
MTANQQLSTYNSMGSINNFQNLTPPPPPPPMPEQMISSSPQSYSPPREHYSPGPSLQPPGPPPPLPSTSPRPRRLSALPQPPVNGSYYALPAPPHDFLNVGPPPPLPMSSSMPSDMYNIGPPPPLPAPPVQVNRQWGPRTSQQWN